MKSEGKIAQDEAMGAVGDAVMVWRRLQVGDGTRKLRTEWSGPHSIVKIRSDSTVEVDASYSGVKAVPISRIHKVSKEYLEYWNHQVELEGKALEGKGLIFNTPDLAAFKAALGKTDFYKKARAKFGDEAWALLQKYAGDVG